MRDILLKEIGASEVKEYFDKMHTSLKDDFLIHVRHKSGDGFVIATKYNLEKLSTKDFLQSKYYLEIINK